MSETPIIASKRFKEYRKRFYDMTEQEAATVRKLRIDEGKTWEEVAVEVSCDGDFGVIPIKDEKVAGMMLCEKAAEIYDELYLSAPWYKVKEVLLNE